MSDKPKTTKIYLMVECEVRDGGDGSSPEHRARATVCDALHEACVFIDDDESMVCYEYGEVAVKEPVVLPENIKEILWRESVSHLSLYKQLEAAVIEGNKRPAKERWREMIERGVIDEKGDVLLHGPWNEEEWEEHE